MLCSAIKLGIPLELEPTTLCYGLDSSTAMSQTDANDESDPTLPSNDDPHHMQHCSAASSMLDRALPGTPAPRERMRHTEASGGSVAEKHRAREGAGVRTTRGANVRSASSRRDSNDDESCDWTPLMLGNRAFTEAGPLGDDETTIVSSSAEDSPNSDAATLPESSCSATLKRHDLVVRSASETMITNEMKAASHCCDTSTRSTLDNTDRSYPRV
jgi:hypothetical protein